MVHDHGGLLAPGPPPTQLGRPSNTQGGGGREGTEQGVSRGQHGGQERPLVRPGWSCTECCASGSPRQLARMPLMESGDVKAALDSPEKEALGSRHTASRGPLRDCSWSPASFWEDWSCFLPVEHCAGSCGDHHQPRGPRLGLQQTRPRVGSRPQLHPPPQSVFQNFVSVFPLLGFFH